MNLENFLLAVRAKRPLVHHLTNWVTIYDCAQVVKSLGASPVMAHAAEEADAMTSLAGALVLNIGTLTTDLIASMKRAIGAARQRRLPVILDVCGAGATGFRDQMSAALLDTGGVTIIKGNASEIARVAGLSVATKGVDAGQVAADLVAVAKALAQARDAVVVVTGEQDIVASADTVYRVANGHPLMAQVVGTGCMATSVIGTFVAATPEAPALAAAAGLAAYEIAAELAVAKAPTPMAFKLALLDGLHALTPADVASRHRVTVVAQ
jgi:hydroxyethylthiazole kinase